MSENPFLHRISYTPRDPVSDTTEVIVQIHRLRELIEQIKSFLRTIERLSSQDVEFAQDLLVPDILINMEKINLSLLPPSLRGDFARLTEAFHGPRIQMWEVNDLASKINYTLHKWLGSPGDYDSSRTTTRSVSHASHWSRVVKTQLSLLLSLLCVIVAGAVVVQRLLIASTTTEDQAFGLGVVTISVLLVFVDVLFGRRVKTP
jgi:hypothetical protein